MSKRDIHTAQQEDKPAPITLEDLVREIVRVKDGVYVGGDEYGIVQENLIDDISGEVLDALLSEIVDS